jgi:hypothetical protein
LDYIGNRSIVNLPVHGFLSRAQVTIAQRLKTSRLNRTCWPVLSYLAVRQAKRLTAAHVLR